MAMSPAPQVLVVAGSDSSGGAGIARDVETLCRFGLRAALAVTAVTAQTSRRVVAVEPMPPALVESQMRAALSSGCVRTVKLGMLGLTETADAVRAVLEDHPRTPVVIDAVLASTSGRRLLEGDAAAVYRRLFPLAALVTPNVPELGLLAGGHPAGDERGAIGQAKVLLAQGARAVLVKGGHASGTDAADLLVTPEGVQRFVLPRLAVTLRGTGCALASGIAAQLALGRALPEAIAIAKEWLHDLMAREGSPDRG